MLTKKEKESVMIYGYGVLEDGEYFDIDDSWLITADTIVKYRPENYDENGHYTKVEEWSEFCQIGKSFNHKRLKASECIEVEERYIHAVQVGMQLSGCTYLIVDNLYVNKDEGDNRFNNSHKLYQYFKPLYKSFINSYPGRRIHISKVADYIRLNLRGPLSCDLINKEHNFYVRFGYDYYMYFNSNINEDILKKEIEAVGLFVNPSVRLDALR